MRDTPAELLAPYRARRCDIMDGRCQHCGRQRPTETYVLYDEQRNLCLVCAGRHFGALVMQELHLDAIGRE